MNNAIGSIKILSWNAASLPSKIGELRELVSRIHPDIIMVQETHLRSSNRVSIPNYLCYRDDKQPPTTQCPHPKHGTAIFIRSSIAHYSIPSPTMTNIQATILNIQIPKMPPFHVASIYIRNKPSAALTSELETLVSGNNRFILAGDFNSHHRRWTTRYNRAGKMLSDFSDNNGFHIIAPPTPTRFGYSL